VIKRFMSLVTVAALMVAMLLPTAAANARLQADPVVVEVGPTAKVLEDGQAVRVMVKVACEPGWQVLEANVSATQGATSSLAGIGGVVCDGKPHVHKVRVEALDGQFSRGTASVSAFVLLLDPATQTTVQGQDARTVSVVGAR
jgi:hypothetical protein